MSTDSLQPDKSLAWAKLQDHLAELAVHLSSCSTIALDTEFVREKTYLPQLGLIQIADRDDAWIVDPLALDVEAMAPLLEIFVNPLSVLAPGILRDLFDLFSPNSTEPAE